MKYDADKLRKRVKNRLFKQLYPTVAVCVLYVLCLLALYPEYDAKETILHTVYDPAKRGYWFTFSLVQVFLVFSVVLHAFDRYNVRLKMQSIVFTAVFFIASFVAVLHPFPTEDSPAVFRQFFSVLSLEKSLNLLPFFVFGCLCRMNEKSFLRIITHPYTFFVSCVLLGISCFFDGDLSYYVHRCSSLVAVISFFGMFSGYFSPASTLGRYLVRTGKSTLPVYLFHFFVLLLMSVFVSEYVETIKDLLDNPALEVGTVLVVSVLITEVVLLFEKGLKRAPVVHKLIYSY